MLSTATIANPQSHSQTCDTFRAAAGTEHGAATGRELDQIERRRAPSYFAASAGEAPLAVLREYVEQQRASSPGPERRGFQRGES